MRKAGLIILTAALFGGIIFWTQKPKKASYQNTAAEADGGALQTPSSSSSIDTPPMPDAEEKVVPKAAPFVRSAPQAVPQEALSQHPSYSREENRAINEAVEHPEIYPSVDELVLVTLDAALGRTAAYQASINRSHQGWTYICGRPLEFDRTAFDYTRSRMKSRAQTGPVEDMFCLLAAPLEKGYELKEFSLGASDNPMEGWAENHSNVQSLILGTIEK